MHYISAPAFSHSASKLRLCLIWSPGEATSAAPASSDAVLCGPRDPGGAVARVDSAALGGRQAQVPDQLAAVRSGTAAPHQE